MLMGTRRGMGWQSRLTAAPEPVRMVVERAAKQVARGAYWVSDWAETIAILTDRELVADLLQDHNEPLLDVDLATNTGSTSPSTSSTSNGE